MPGVVKYSAFATNVTRRDSVSGMNSQSAYERWLLARMTAPSSGTFSPPSVCGRKMRRSSGPTNTHLSNQ